MPLLVEEVVDAHLRGGSVVIDGGHGPLARRARAVPQSVRGMVAARLEQLPSPSGTCCSPLR